MPQIVPDQVAEAVGDQKVVTFRCFVSAGRQEDQLRLVTDPLFADKWFVAKTAVVFQWPGTERPDGWSIVWVKAEASVTNDDGDEVGAVDAAIDVRRREARTGPITARPGEGADPPPPPHPR